MSAKLKKDSTYKKSSLAGIEGGGGTQKPKSTVQKIQKALKNTNKSGKKV
jgi:hypothetical protein